MRLHSVDGAAVAGHDFLQVDLVVAFAAGQAEVEVELEVVDDGTWEEAEGFQLQVARFTTG